MIHILGAVAAAFFVASCNDGSSTETAAPRPGLHFVSGTSGVDTIEAILPKPLVVEFRDENNQPLANRRVVFISSSLPTADSTSFTTGVTLTIGTATTDTLRGFVAGMTDANGRISAEVRLGKGVGEATVITGIENTAIRDTARYVVRPGAAARVRLLPRDTAMYIAARLQLRVAAKDRMGNATTGSTPVVYATSNGLTVSSTGIVTPRDPGRAFIVARTGIYSDSIPLTVIPTTGVLTASLPIPLGGGATGIVVMNLDGSGYKEYPNPLGPVSGFNGAQPRFTVDGTALIVGTTFPSASRLMIVPLDGSAPRRFLVNPTLPTEGSPAPSPDGQWVYYCAGPSVGVPLVHRARLDGTGIQMLPSPTPVLNDSLCASLSISANGQWLAWTLPGDGRLKTRSVTTGVRTAFNREGTNPAFAPTGTRLAYIKGNPSPIYTAEYDGSDDRFVAQGLYNGPLSWTVDGKFILAQRAANLKWELVDAVTGTAYVLPFASIGPNATLRPAVR